MFTPGPPPDGTRSSLEHERELCKLADALQSAALALMVDRTDRIALATAKELALASVRARKVAAELGHAREGIDYEVWLVGEHAKLRGNPQAPRHLLRRVP